MAHCAAFVRAALESVAAIFRSGPEGGSRTAHLWEAMVVRLISQATSGSLRVGPPHQSSISLHRNGLQCEVVDLRGDLALWVGDRLQSSHRVVGVAGPLAVGILQDAAELPRVVGVGRRLAARVLLRP